MKTPPRPLHHMWRLRRRPLPRRRAMLLKLLHHMWRLRRRPLPRRRARRLKPRPRTSRPLRKPPPPSSWPSLLSSLSADASSWALLAHAVRGGEPASTDGVASSIEYERGRMCRPRLTTAASSAACRACTCRPARCCSCASSCHANKQGPREVVRARVTGRPHRGTLRPRVIGAHQQDSSESILASFTCRFLAIRLSIRSRRFVQPLQSQLIIPACEQAVRLLQPPGAVPLLARALA